MLVAPELSGGKTSIEAQGSKHMAHGRQLQLF
jgi:hypothetical protein